LTITSAFAPARQEMAEKQSDLDRDYFVLIRRDRRLPLWSWEIRRRSRQLGIKIFGQDFESAAAAKRAGDEALKQLLKQIAGEAIHKDL
jgi:hypothetical protein